MQLLADSEQKVSEFQILYNSFRVSDQVLHKLKEIIIPAIYSKPKVSDGSGQSKVCNNKKKGDQFPIYVQGAFLTGPSKIFTDYIVNPIKKVSEFTYRLALLARTS